MSEFQNCPECDKPVNGRGPLLAHLEFSHAIEDPADHLAALEAPPPAPRSWVRPARIAALVVANVVLIAVTVVASGAIGGGGASADAGEVAADETPAAAGSDDADAETDRESDDSATTAPPTTAPTTTAAPRPTPTTTTAAPKDEDDRSAEVDPTAFRKPFVIDGRIESCSTSGGKDVYAVAIEFSGARDIVFDGQPYPGGSADGEHVIEHAVPADATAYFDHVEVADGAGNVYRVDVSPPVYLGGCG